MSVIEPIDKWPLVTQELNMKKGPLVKVEIGPGQYVKMYEADAIKQGHIKSKPAEKNKMLTPERDKAKEEAKPQYEPPKTSDDFTEIAGVGPATARSLMAHGITTFQELIDAGDLDFVSPQTMKAIEEWRQVNDLC
jgi:predicted flap endonuclease-1-like 5' DNA nuclease